MRSGYRFGFQGQEGDNEVNKKKHKTFQTFGGKMNGMSKGILPFAFETL
jgi:hypothetical protein